MCKIQHLEFSRFPPYVTSRRHCGKAVSFEKKRSFVMILGSLNCSSRCLCVYMLAHEGKVVGLIAKVSFH